MRNLLPKDSHRISAGFPFWKLLTVFESQKTEVPGRRAEVTWLGDHSARSALRGSTCAARRAGAHDASAVMISSNSGMAI